MSLSHGLTHLRRIKTGCPGRRALLCLPQDEGDLLLVDRDFFTS
jgi:hypothetical protein